MSDQLKDIKALYQTAFQKYGTVALWNMRPVKQPTIADALVITKYLRTYGGMQGRLFAEQIEEICHASH
jgi:hypothetical protein